MKTKHRNTDSFRMSEIERALGRLFYSGVVVEELRAVKEYTTTSGYFGNHKGLTAHFTVVDPPDGIRHARSSSRPLQD